MRVFVLCLMLITLPSWAKCSGNNDLGDISFDKNSSYFGASGIKLLDTIASGPDSAQGYLLLEFAFDRSEGDERLQKYNMWLAQRRIDRVREYLGNKGFPAPVVSLIRTAAADDSRKLQLSWCENDETTADDILADR